MRIGQRVSNGDGDADKRPMTSRASDCDTTPAGRSIASILRTHDAAQPYLDEIARIQQESSVQTVSLMSWINGAPKPEQLERYLDEGSKFQVPSSKSESSGFADSGSRTRLQAYDKP